MSDSQFGPDTPWAKAAAEYEAKHKGEEGAPGVSGSSSQFGPDTPWAKAAANYMKNAAKKIKRKK